MNESPRCPRCKQVTAFADELCVACDEAETTLREHAHRSFTQQRCELPCGLSREEHARCAECHILSGETHHVEALSADGFCAACVQSRIRRGLAVAS